MNPALMRKVFHTDVSTSTLLWDEGPFLVEMYLMRPNAKVVQHSHPFDNIVIFLNGKMKGTRQGAKQEATWWDERHSEMIGMELPANLWHQFEIGSEGCCFLNVSKWHDMTEKTSATIKYIGQPLGPIHAKQLASNNGTA